MGSVGLGVSAPLSSGCSLVVFVTDAAAGGGIIWAWEREIPPRSCSSLSNWAITISAAAASCSRRLFSLIQPCRIYSSPSAAPSPPLCCWLLSRPKSPNQAGPSKPNVRETDRFPIHAPYIGAC